jgi:hypothetical protein
MRRPHRRQHARVGAPRARATMGTGSPHRSPDRPPHATRVLAAAQLNALTPLAIRRARLNALRTQRGAASAAPEADGVGASEKDAKLAQKLVQLQPFIAVFPQECMGQFSYFGPT